MAELHCGFSDIPGGAKGYQLLHSYGPTILVNIGFDVNYKPDLPIKIPIPGLKGLKALVDTGASESCIDSLLAAQLNLPVVDKRMVSGIHGSLQVNVHLAQIHIPGLNVTHYGMFSAVHLAAGGQHHQALLGRNFLRHCTMTYDGKTGRVIIIK